MQYPFPPLSRAPHFPGPPPPVGSAVRSYREANASNWLQVVTTNIQSVHDSLTFYRGEWGANNECYEMFVKHSSLIPDRL